MEESIEGFLVALAAEKQCSPHTVVAYRNDLLQLTAHLRGQGVAMWSEAAPEQVGGYLAYLRERQYASSTIARKTAAMKSFFVYLRQRGEVMTDLAPFLAAPHVDRYTPYAISTDEMTRLLAAPVRAKTPEGARDAAMLELLYATGMRVSELVALNLGDVDGTDDVIRCQGRADRERLLPLTKTAAAALEHYLLQSRPVLSRAKDADATALFLNHRGHRLTRQGFWLILKGYAASVSVRNVTPHTLRHTFAAHALKTGRHLRDVQTTLGHVSISTTQIYQRLRATTSAPSAALDTQAEPAKPTLSLVAPTNTAPLLTAGSDVGDG